MTAAAAMSSANRVEIFFTEQVRAWGPRRRSSATWSTPGPRGRCEDPGRSGNCDVRLSTVRSKPETLQGYHPVALPGVVRTRAGRRSRCWRYESDRKGARL